ncbi:hypothetical protein PRZ48_014075 [Zasmidium cellare]|uniref:Uncharacterized protein n=1 Tax=Zasmidium cellare TaxID=395010 RepID=A0ABR0DZY7_ZASCE|nr:hypothetical protein PRZ48_014075 [Zasmidium cellare]
MASKAEQVCYIAALPEANAEIQTGIDKLIYFGNPETASNLHAVNVTVNARPRLAFSTRVSCLGRKDGIYPRLSTAPGMR